MNGTVDRSTQRYLKLVEELRDEMGGRHGWKANAARMLHVDPSYLSILTNQTRVSVGRDVIEKAMKHIKLRPEYFFGDQEPRSYLDYVGGRYSAFDEFCNGDHGRTMTPAERDQLASIDFQGQIPDLATYDAILYALRGTERGRAKELEIYNRSVDAEMKAHSRRLSASVNANKRTPARGDTKKR